MVKATGFPSWLNSFHFAFARQFAPADPQRSVNIAMNRLEKLGHFLSKPILQPLNFFLREIKNPLVILALTVSLVAIATLIFYPAQFMLVVTTVLPFLAKVEPWMVKLALFVCVETVILGIGLRALGRMCNKELRKQWHDQKIVPVHIGAKKL